VKGWKDVKGIADWGNSKASPIRSGNSGGWKFVHHPFRGVVFVIRRTENKRTDDSVADREREKNGPCYVGKTEEGYKM